jgi:hypothetical protein
VIPVSVRRFTLMVESAPHSNPPPVKHREGPQTTGFLAKASIQIQDRRIQVAAVFLLGVAFTCMYHPMTRAISGDNALYVYIAQSIVRGQVPYRDVVDIKGPGSVYISAAAMIAGRLFGVRDFLADRLAQILMTGLLCSVTFLVAVDYLRSRMAALIVVLVPLMVPKFMIWMAEGGQPKLSMLLCGMLAMLMISRDRPFWAGWWSMCSCLCWQPGLLFGGTAFLIFSKYLTSWRDKRALKVLVGGATPLAMTLLYLWRIGSLKYFWAYAFEYNYSVFGPDAERTPGAAFVHICKTIERIFGLETIVVVCSSFGLIVYIIARAKARPRLLRFADCPDLYLDAIAIPPLVYLAFCLINFQAGPDLILFFPFFGLFAAYLFLRADSLLQARGFLGLYGPNRIVKSWVVAPIAGLLFITALAVAAYNWRQSYSSIEWQQNQFKTVANLLGPGDTIYTHGSAEILVLLGKQNLNSLVFVDWGMDDFVAHKWYGGSFQKIIDEMEAQAPKVVSLSRLGHVNHGKDWERWAREHYDPVPVTGYEVYVRKPN